MRGRVYKVRGGSGRDKRGRMDIWANFISGGNEKEGRGS